MTCRDPNPRYTTAMPRMNPDGTRDYSYDKKYAARPMQKKRRAQRNAARAIMVKAGKAFKGDGKDVDHKSKSKTGPLNNSTSNLKVMSRSRNRAKK